MERLEDELDVNADMKEGPTEAVLLPGPMSSPPPPLGATPPKLATPQALPPPSPLPPTSAYRLLIALGQGGMGQVYLAESAGLGGFRKLVVLKQLRPSLKSDPDFLDMFLQEARLAARLNHPNVVQTNEAGCDEAGNYFLAMEYLDGQPLNRVWKRIGAKAQLQASLHIVSAALEGLHYAHELQDFDGSPLHVVHRDVSPQNVFVTYTGSVKIIDFGIAKAAGSSVHTQEGMYRGKLSYASPEQIAGDSVDRRTDIYSVGVMLFETLTGKPMWEGLSNVEIVRRVVMGELPSVDDAAPDMLPELRRICAKALSHHPHERYDTARDMRLELEACIEAHGLRQQPVALGEMLAQAFTLERDELNRKIEQQLRLATPTPSRPNRSVTSSHPMLPRSSVPPPPRMSGPMAPPRSSVPPPSALPIDLSALLPVAPGNQPLPPEELTLPAAYLEPVRLKPWQVAARSGLIALVVLLGLGIVGAVTLRLLAPPAPAAVEPALVPIEMPTLNATPEPPPAQPEPSPVGKLQEEDAPTVVEPVALPVKPPPAVKPAPPVRAKPVAGKPLVKKEKVKEAPEVVRERKPVIEIIDDPAVQVIEE